MDTNCTRYIVENIESRYDSAEHIYDSLFIFLLNNQEYFGEKVFTGDAFATLFKLRSNTPSDDISKCPKSSLFTWRADKALEFIESEFEKNQYPVSTFNQYLKDYSKDILKAGESVEPAGASLAAFLFVSPLPEHKALTSRLGKDIFETLKITKAKDILDVLVSVVPQELKGGEETAFIKALNNISLISAVWDNMKIIDAPKKLKQTEIPKLSDTDFFEIYGGNYTKIPKNYKIPNDYYKLSKAEQNSIVKYSSEPDYVKAFLIANFDKFNSLLENSAITVFRQIKRANLNSFNNEVNKYSAKLSFYSSDNSKLMNMFNSITSIPSKYNLNKREVDLPDIVDAIIHSYIPTLQRFKKSRMYNVSLSTTMISSGSNSLLLGAATYLQQPIYRSAAPSISKASVDIMTAPCLPSCSPHIAESH